MPFARRPWTPSGLCGAFILALVIIGAMAASNSSAQQIIMSDRNKQGEEKPQQFLLPFAFYTDSTRFAAGVAGASSGVAQDQLFFGGALFVSTNGSLGLYMLSEDLQIRPIDRLFLDSEMYLTRFAESEEFVDGNPDFPGQAGANDSSPFDLVQAETVSLGGEFVFKYVLPIGAGKESPIARYKLSRGILTEGSTSTGAWNPLTSGRTFLEFTPFVYYRELDPNHETESDRFSSTGIRIGARWDNSDFPDNPSFGNRVIVRLTRDFDIFGSTGQYTELEAEYEQFIPLGRSKWFRQQVLALDAWTVADLAGTAPYYLGATLGGYERMRAFSFNRFHDRAALVGTAELRLTLDYNPVQRWRALDDLVAVDWIQLVLFGEAGRVADNWDLGELLSDMQWDVGFGLRLLSHHSVARLDVGFAEEGVSMWVMFGHSF